MLANNKNGFFPYTPATNLLYGLAEAIDMLHEEGLDNVFARHERHGEATRRAVRAWGLENLCSDDEVLFARADRGGDARGPQRRRASARSRSSTSTCRSAPASAKVAGKVFRIGHLGDTNDLTIIGTLAGVEMGLGTRRRAAQGRVDDDAEGQGVGSDLVRTALDQVREEGLRVVAQCPFVKEWIRRHPDYADLTS